MLSDALRGALHITDVGLLVLVKRCRHADGHCVNIPDKIEIGGSTQETCFHHILKLIAYNIADIIMAGVH